LRENKSNFRSEKIFIEIQTIFVDLFLILGMFCSAVGSLPKFEISPGDECEFIPLLSPEEDR